MDKELKFRSIAFPALGTGNLKFPPEVVARCMISSIHDYVTSNPQTNVREVHAVLFPADKATQKVCLPTQSSSVFFFKLVFIEVRKTFRDSALLLRSMAPLLGLGQDLQQPRHQLWDRKHQRIKQQVKYLHFSFSYDPLSALLAKPPFFSEYATISRNRSLWY